MPRPVCDTCAGSTSTPRNFLLVCACGGAWHHRCVDPPMNQDALLAMVAASNCGMRAHSIDAWRCAKCAGKHVDAGSVGEGGWVSVKRKRGSTRDRGVVASHDGMSQRRRSPLSPVPVWPPIRHKGKRSPKATSQGPRRLLHASHPLPQTLRRVALHMSPSMPLEKTSKHSVRSLPPAPLPTESLASISLSPPQKFPSVRPQYTSSGPAYVPTSTRPPSPPVRVAVPPATGYTPTPLSAAPSLPVVDLQRALRRKRGAVMQRRADIRGEEGGHEDQPVKKRRTKQHCEDTEKKRAADTQDANAQEQVQFGGMHGARVGAHARVKSHTLSLSLTAVHKAVPQKLSELEQDLASESEVAEDLIPTSLKAFAEFKDPLETKSDHANEAEGIEQTSVCKGSRGPSSLPNIAGPTLDVSAELTSGVAKPETPPEAAKASLARPWRQEIAAPHEASTAPELPPKSSLSDITALKPAQNIVEQKPVLNEESLKTQSPTAEPEPEPPERVPNTEFTVEEHTHLRSQAEDSSYTQSQLLQHLEGSLPTPGGSPLHDRINEVAQALTSTAFTLSTLRTPVLASWFMEFPTRQARPTRRRGHAKGVAQMREEGPEFTFVAR